MKRAISLLVLVLAALAADAQTLLIPTTTAAAVSDSKVKQIVVTSATGFAVGNDMYIDRELMAIQTISGTTITVQRGAGGTVAKPHMSGAYVFQATPSYFFAKQPPAQPGGACTRSTELVLPYINVVDGSVYDCLGGYWVKGTGSGAQTETRFRVASPDPGGTAYTSLNSTGTTLASTKLYCTETFLPSNKLLTGAAILAGTTVGTDKWYVVLYDNAGNPIANSALAGATTATASVYQVRAFAAQYFAVGPAQYFVCFQSNGTTDTARMVVTGTQDNLLTAGQTGATFGTIPALTVPTGFTTAVGPYVYLY